MRLHGLDGPAKAFESVERKRSRDVPMERLLMYRSGSLRRWLARLLPAVLWAVTFVSPLRAEDQNVPANAPAGVLVSPDGVLRLQTAADPMGAVMRERVAAARQALPPDIARYSRLRKVSLPRLERAIIAANGVVSDEMRYMAGLLRVRYVFVYPDSGDIVLAGPAEGWVPDPAGRVVGITSGKPVIQLQDVVTALRAYPSGKEGPAVIGCSIDPTQEGLAKMQDFLRRMGGTFPRGQEVQTARYMSTGVKNSLGLQEITIEGIPADTHFARILVEADYRMKLIGIGLETPPVRLTSFVEKAASSAVSANALFRWYFVPDYQCLRVTEDGAGLELVGDGVKLVGEDEVVMAGGARAQAATSNAASRAFTTSFTKKYPELAARSPVYAELRNVIDLAVVAAYIQKQDFYTQAGWKMEFLGDEAKFPVRTYPAPKQVESAVNAIIKGSRIMTPIGGGVQIEAEEALQAENLLPDEGNQVRKLHEEVKVSLPADMWWWD